MTLITGIQINYHLSVKCSKTFNVWDMITTSNKYNSASVDVFIFSGKQAGVGEKN